MNLGKEIQNALKVLRDGGIILYPTDTLWGLGCDATNQEAIKRINRLKGREELKPLINLVVHDSMINKYVRNAPDVAWDLIENSDNPLTLILDEGVNLPEGAVNEKGQIAIRMIKHEFCEHLISRLGKPLTSTSANLSGQEPPQTFEDIDPIILEGVDLVVNLQQINSLDVKASTIIRLQNNGEFKILRS